MIGKPNIRFVRHGTLDYFLSITQSQFVIHNTNIHPLVAPKPEQIICATWHGIPLKALGVDMPRCRLGHLYNTQRSFNLSDLHLSSGSFYYRYAVESFKVKIDREKVHSIGFPRNDALVRAEKSPQMNIQKKKKILYAPTWRGDLSDVQEISSEIDSVLKTLREGYSDQYDILVKAHYFTKVPAKEEKGISILPAGVPINDLLPDIDILISDYSSVMVDFLIFDRPIICFAYDEREYDQERGLIIPLEELPVAVCKSIEELERAIMAEKRPSEYRRYSDIKRKLLGAVRDDAAQRTLELLHTPRTLKKRKIATKEVLIYAGAFMPNGITSSFLNLSHAIDPNLAQINVIVPYGSIDKNPERLALLNQTPAHVHMTLVDFRNIPKSVRRSIRSRGRSADTEKGMISKNVLDYFGVAASRHFRNTCFDVAVDFCGYSSLENLLIASSNSKRKVVFQHNDILAERATKQNVPDSILASYSLFDKVVSVGAELAEHNQSNLSNFVTPEQATFARNLINPAATRTKSRAGCAVADAIMNARSRSPEAPPTLTLGSGILAEFAG